MTLRVGINGLGRIGRQTVRTWYAQHRDDFEVVAVNELEPTDLQAHLLRYDSEYGRFEAHVEAPDDETLRLDDRSLRVFHEPNPEAIPWDRAGVEVVVDATGRFRARADASKHLGDGVRKVLITANGRDEDWTVVYGVNDAEYDPTRHHIVSAGSCTTNCVTPVAKLLHERFGIRHASITTVHSYTTTQNLLDSGHKDWRRARAAAHNIIPTTTGAAQAVAKVIPELDGKLDGMAMRVPTSAVSVVDLVAEVEQPATVEEVNELLRAAAEGPMQGVLYYEDEPLVSIDYAGHPGSAIVDAAATMVIDGRLVKTLAWYDNEWGYASRIADLCAMFAERGIE
jgi:glyceraldehyde 3-phosphate dehydrogenase